MTGRMSLEHSGVAIGYTEVLKPCFPSLSSLLSYEYKDSLSLKYVFPKDGRLKNKN